MAARDIGINVFKRQELLDLARLYQAGRISLRNITDDKIGQMLTFCDLGVLGRGKNLSYRSLYSILNCNCSKAAAYRINKAAKESILYSVVCNWKTNEAPKQPKQKADALFAEGDVKPKTELKNTEKSDAKEDAAGAAAEADSKKSASTPSVRTTLSSKAAKADSVKGQEEKVNAKALTKIEEEEEKDK